MPSKPASHLTRNPVSTIGAWITTVSALLFVIGFVADLLGMEANPYLGIVFFLILPGFFVFGLLLIPLGMALERRRRRARRPGHAARVAAARLQREADAHPRVHRGLATVANGVVVALAAYRGVEYMDSVQFCGQLCHSVMQPEFAAYQDGPHSRVACVQCHIGPGAPVVREVEALRPAPGLRGDVPYLCPADPDAGDEPPPGQGHVRTVPLAGEVPRRHREHRPRIRIGREEHRNGHDAAGARRGRRDGTGRPDRHPLARQSRQPDRVRRHRRAAAGDSLRQAHRPCRQCARVRGRGRIGRRSRPRASRGRWTASTATIGPTHAFGASAERALDQAMAFGEIPGTLPFVKREAVAVLKADYPSQAAAVEAIGDTLGRFYKSNYPEIYAGRRAEIDQAIQATPARVPEERVSVHANHLGHPPQQHRSYRLPGLLPLPRRQPQDQGWPDDSAGLRVVPQDGAVAACRNSECAGAGARAS